MNKIENKSTVGIQYFSTLLFPHKYWPLFLLHLHTVNDCLHTVSDCYYGMISG